MKNVKLTLLFLMISGLSYSQKSTVKTNIIEGYNVSFYPQSLKKEIANGVSLNIEPIDPNLLNSIISTSIKSNGEHFGINSYFYKTFLKVKGSKEDKKIKKLSSIYEKIEDFVSQKKISEIESDLLKEKIYQHFFNNNVNWGSLNEDLIATQDEKLDEINPYFYNKKFLSVFKVTVENNSENIEEIELTNFQVVSGTELLVPYTINYFEEMYDNPISTDKIKTLHRINFPNKLRLVGGQSTVKYFATPPLDNTTNNLKINYISGNKADVFEYNVKIENFKNVSESTLFRLKLPYVIPSFQCNVSLVRVDDISGVIGSDKVFIDNTLLNKNMKIINFKILFDESKIDVSELDFIPNKLSKNTIRVK